MYMLEKKNHADTIHHFGSFVFYVVVENPNFHVNIQITNVIFLLISLVGNPMIFRESGNGNLNVPDFTINLLYIQENGKDQIQRSTCSGIHRSYLPKNWALVVQGLLLVVPELQVKGLQRIVVLEADPDRESYVKRWANGEVESTREVCQRQATLDEKAFSRESEEFAEDLVEEEPLDAEEDEKNEGKKEDEEDEGVSDNDDDNDTSGSEASGDEDSSRGNNAMAEAEEVGEEEESDRGYVREHGSIGDIRRGSHSEVDSPLQIRKTERGRGSREPVLRGVLVRGKGKRTMADLRRSLSGRQSVRPARLLRRSMPARVEPEHAVGASPVAAEQQTRMPIRVTRDTQPVAKKRLLLPRHSISPAQPIMDPTSDAVRRRLIVEGSVIPLLGEQGARTGVSTNVNIVAMGPLEPVAIARLSRGSKTSATHTTEASTSHAVVVPLAAPTDPPKDVPPHIMASTIAIALGDAESSRLTEYTHDANGYWRNAIDIRYVCIKPVRPGDALTYIKASIVDAFRTMERLIDWYNDEAPLEGPLRIASEVAMAERKNEVPSPTPDLSASGMHRDVEAMEVRPRLALRHWSSGSPRRRQLLRR